MKKFYELTEDKARERLRFYLEKLQAVQTKPCTVKNANIESLLSEKIIELKEYLADKYLDICSSCYNALILPESFGDYCVYHEIPKDMQEEIEKSVSLISKDYRFTDEISREDFSRLSCDCCHSVLHGERIRIGFTR